MKVLLDECLPKRLAAEFSGHEARTVPEQGWAGLRNGELLEHASLSFDVFVTADQNLEYQQALRRTSIAVIVLVAVRNDFATLRALMPEVLKALGRIKPAQLLRIPSAR